MRSGHPVEAAVMTRGAKAHRPEAPERRCVATGERQPAAGLIRFVLAPDGASVAPDLAGRLPGRGAWLTADRTAADRAEKKRLFSRAFKRPVTAPEGLADLLERLLAQRLIETIALARKAGAAVTGFEKVRARLRDGADAVLMSAAEASEDGVKKLEKLAGARPRIAVLDASELGLAFGREFAIHAALDAGRLADRALAEAGRLAGFREAGGANVIDAATTMTRPRDMAQAPPPAGDPGSLEGQPVTGMTDETGGIRPPRDDE
ncbi:MAG: RNA-binding protein [Pseudomonadota bacterium]